MLYNVGAWWAMGCGVGSSVQECKECVFVLGLLCVMGLNQGTQFSIHLAPAEVAAAVQPCYEQHTSSSVYRSG